MHYSVFIQNHCMWHGDHTESKQQRQGFLRNVFLCSPFIYLFICYHLLSTYDVPSRSRQLDS